MKGKIKWVALFGLLGMVLTGCMGPGSSDEGPVSATENGVLTTLQVTVNSEGMSIEPVTLGAVTAWPCAWVLNEQVQLNGVDWVILAQSPASPGSVDVCSVAFSSKSVCSGTKYAGGVDFKAQNISYPADPRVQISRIDGGAIGDGQNVYVNYTVCPDLNLVIDVTSSNIVSAGNSVTADLTITNKTNYRFEKVRSWTGLVSGPGEANNPTILSDYPTVSYGVPLNAPGLIEGWTSGNCFTTWGDLDGYDGGKNQKVEGCDLMKHWQDPAIYYLHQWLDPVCGKLTTNWKMMQTQNEYMFYAQLSGNAYSAYPYASQEDSRFDGVNYPTTYALLASLTYDPSINDPDNGIIWCNPETEGGLELGWWAGSLRPIKYGDPNTCGTLITDPHLSAGTYFALNVGLEMADTIEARLGQFWTLYNSSTTRRNPNYDQGYEGLYQDNLSVALIYDPNVLDAFTTAGEYYLTGGNTLFSAGFHHQEALVGSMDTSPWNQGAMTEIISDTLPGYLLVNQVIASSFTFWGTTGASYVYITNIERCRPTRNLPRWAAHWGVTHYETGCAFVVDGVDDDIDYWYGLMVFKVKDSANTGDWTYLKVDQSDSNFNTYVQNNNTASDTNDGWGDFCISKTLGITTCPVGSGADWIGYATGGVTWAGLNPLLPPANKLQGYLPTDCPYGDGFRTCGGYQTITGVVCVQ